MSQLFSGRFTRSSRGVVVVLVIAAIFSSKVCADPDPPAPEQAIRLELSPRICTLSRDDKQCTTEVRASWDATRSESLCLIILERPDVKRCWEGYSEGTYSIKLSFSDDLNFQLRDPGLREALASQVLRVIREAIRYRHKRREPWNVFE